MERNCLNCRYFRMGYCQNDRFEIDSDFSDRIQIMTDMGEHKEYIEESYGMGEIELRFDRIHDDIIDALSDTKLTKKFMKEFTTVLGSILEKALDDIKFEIYEAAKHTIDCLSDGVKCKYNLQITNVGYGNFVCSEYE